MVEATTRRATLLTELARCKVVAVIRAGHEIDVVSLGTTLLTAGVPFVEITLTTPGALEAIRALQPVRAEGLHLGAGTVLGVDAAESAIAAGVDFLVSPTLEVDIIPVAHAADAAAFIGGLTPTEILAAWRAGADVVKVFPGRVGTPEYFADLAGPLPDIPLMPTGNVNPTTARAYLASGAIAVGVGKALVDPGHLQARRFGAIRAEAVRWRGLLDGLEAAHL